MTWFKVDDKLHDHRKARRAGCEAMGFWTMAGSWSADNLTDGFIPEDVARRWHPEPEELANVLVDVGLWSEAVLDGERGWQFHDWKGYQPAAADVTRRRAEWADRQRRYREARATAKSDPVMSRGDDEGDEDASHAVTSQAMSPRDIARDSRVESQRESRSESPRPLRTGRDGTTSLPVPSKTSTQVDLGGGSYVTRANERASGASPTDLTEIPEDWKITDAMRRWANQTFGPAVPDLDFETAQFVSHYRSTGSRRKSWPDAWQKWIRRAVEDRASRPQARASPKPSTTDQRVADAQALKLRMFGPPDQPPKEITS